MGATPIDNNDADGKSGKLYGWLLIIRCTRENLYLYLLSSYHTFLNPDILCTKLLNKLDFLFINHSALYG